MGGDRFPAAPFVVCVNHSSYFDGPVVAAALPSPASFIAKAELTGNWVPRIFLKRLGIIFVERFNARRAINDADAAVGALKNGRPIVYFPEGTLSRMAGLLPFQLGAFQLAVRARVPVVPLVVRGTRQVMRDGSWVPQAHPVTIEALDPIQPPSEGEEWEAAVRLRDRVRAAILSRVGEPDLAYERPLEALAKEAKA
jgi:1-acyl-sn-glycerol-3-phosphate acyltransferase